MSREDQYNVTVSLDGTSIGTFDKMSGGDVDSDETKYKPGAMAEEITLGGSKNTSNVTVSRLYDFDRDHAIKATLIAAAGASEMTVSKQPLDVDGNAYGDPLTYTGKLKKVAFPDHDSESSSAAMVELEMSCAGSPS